MIIQKLYEANPKLTGEIISYAKTILMLPPEIVKFNDIIVISIIEEYLYNHHNIIINVSPKTHYIYQHESLVYECDNAKFTTLDLKRDLIIYITNNFIK